MLDMAKIQDKPSIGHLDRRQSSAHWLRRRALKGKRGDLPSRECETKFGSTTKTGGWSVLSTLLSWHRGILPFCLSAFLPSCLPAMTPYALIYSSQNKCPGRLSLRCITSNHSTLQAVDTRIIWSSALYSGGWIHFLISITTSTHEANLFRRLRYPTMTSSS